MRKQTKIAAMVSAAALLAIGASVTSLAAVGWLEDANGEWQWFDSYGDPVYDAWKTGKDGGWYYLGEDGYMLKNEVFEDTKGHIFWVDETGLMQTEKWLQLNNSDDLDVNGDGVEETTLYMYFDKDGQAIKADEGDVITSFDVKGLTYLFDENGYMMNGWVRIDSGKPWDIYYCGDENDGHVRKGWKELVPPVDHVCPTNDEEHWYYFQSNGRAYVKADGEKYIEGKWYSFDEDGLLRSGWQEYADYPQSGKSTPPDADGTYVYNSTDGSLGYGWVYAAAPDDDAGCFDPSHGSGSKHWYYLMTYRNTDPDTNKAYAVRSVAFNAGNTYDAAKNISGKTYLFDKAGRMKYGLQVIKNDDWRVAPGGVADAWLSGTPTPEEWVNPDSARYGGLFNTTSVTYLPGGIYYFEDRVGSRDSSAGQMVTGKVTLTDDENTMIYDYNFAKQTVTYPKYVISDTGEVDMFDALAGKKVDAALKGVDPDLPPEDDIHYYYRHQGQAYTNAIVDGILYGPDGRRIQAEDGNSWAVVSLDDLRDFAAAENGNWNDNSDVYYIKNNKAYNLTTDKVGEYGASDEKVHWVIVSNTGRVKTSGSVKIDDVTFTIDSSTLQATPHYEY